MKKIAAILLVMVMVFSFAACAAPKPAETPKETPTETVDKVAKAYELVKDGDSKDLPRPDKPTKKYTIGVLLPMLANPHFVAQSYGYYDEAEQLGAEVILFECGGYANFDKQIQQMEDLISMPVDAICLVAAEPNATAPAVDKAVAAGIPVVNVNVLTNNDKVVSRVRSDDLEVGGMEAKFHGEKLNGKGNVLMINGVPGATWAVGRAKGYKDYVTANYPDIKILDERWCDNDPAAALKEMDDALQVYGDQIDAVYCPGEIFAKGIVQAIESAGKTGKIIVTAVDPSKDGVALIKEGKIDAMVVQSSVGQGRWGIRAAIMALEGKADQLTKRYWTPINLVTAENVNDFVFVDKSMPAEGWVLP